jgi:hypothetical protein
MAEPTPAPPPENGRSPLPAAHPAPSELPGDNYLMLVIKKGFGPGGIEERDLRSLQEGRHGRRRARPAAAG